MATCYGINNLLGGTQQNLSTTFKSILVLTSSNSTQTRRLALYKMVMGADGTPADNALVWDCSRQTAAGTATSITPVALDGADAAALAAAAANATVEGTITSNSSVMAVTFNQRGTYTWMAYDDKAKLIAPATNAAGFAIRARSPAYASTTIASAEFEQL